ncbi:MAG TPA: hypothetical protein VNJ04_20085 [Gemmatimonadaceae bacterium]|nr:hypothetical protein [Gemmatimonadaceae bacterium]
MIKRIGITLALFGCGLIALLVAVALIAPYDPNGLNGMLFAKPTASRECQPHIELKSAGEVARELGRDEAWVLHNYKVNLWERHGSNRGQKTGEMIPGSRAVILESAENSYRVRSPLTGEGWVSRVQVANTLHQDAQTRLPCQP